MKEYSVRTWRGALVVWAVGILIEALAYQAFRLLIRESIDSSWFLLVFGRYLLFRVVYSLIPITMGIAFIHANKLSIRWAYLVVLITSLVAPLYFTIYETRNFDPSIIGFCIISIVLLYLLRFKLNLR